MPIRQYFSFAALVFFALSPAHDAAAVNGQDSTDWEFRVLLDDKEIGYHTFSLTRDDDEQILRTEAKFDVKLLFITAFRYRHQNTETWRDGCLAGIAATTRANGKTLTVSGKQVSDRFSVTSNTGEASLPNCVQTFAYWNPAILKSSRLLNSQTGEYEKVTVTLEGDDSVVVGDRDVAAKRYILSTKAGDIKLWYADDTGLWLALEAPAKGGRQIRYEPVDLPPANAGERIVAGNG